MILYPVSYNIIIQSSGSEKVRNETFVWLQTEISRDFKRTSKYNSIQMSRTLAYLRCSKNLRDTCNRLYMSIAFYCSITKEMIHLPFISNAITHLLHIYHTKVMSGENKVLLSFNQAFIILPVIVIIRSIFFHNRLKRGSISIQVKPELNRQIAILLPNAIYTIRS